MPNNRSFSVAPSVLSRENMHPWDTHHHVSHSKNNHCYHAHYRQFFDKPCGDHDYCSPLKYVYKTPSNG